MAGWRLSVITVATTRVSLCRTEPSLAWGTNIKKLIGVETESRLCTTMQTTDAKRNKKSDIVERHRETRWRCMVGRW